MVLPTADVHSRYYTWHSISNSKAYTIEIPIHHPRVPEGQKVTEILQSSEEPDGQSATYNVPFRLVCAAIVAVEK